MQAIKCVVVGDGWVAFFQIIFHPIKCELSSITPANNEILYFNIKFKNWFGL